MDTTTVVTEATEAVATTVAPVVTEAPAVTVTPNVEVPGTNHAWGYAIGAGGIALLAAAGIGIYFGVKKIKANKAKKEAEKNAAEVEETVED